MTLAEIGSVKEVFQGGAGAVSPSSGDGGTRGAVRFNSIPWSLAAASASARCHPGKRKDPFRAEVAFTKHLGRTRGCVLFRNSTLFLNYFYVLLWNWKLCNSFDPLSRYCITKCFRTWVAIFFCQQKLTAHFPLYKDAGFGTGLFWLGLVHNFSVFISILPMLPLGLQAGEHPLRWVPVQANPESRQSLKLPFKTLYTACLTTAPSSEAIRAVLLHLIAQGPHNVFQFILF